MRAPGGPEQAAEYRLAAVCAAVGLCAFAPAVAQPQLQLDPIVITASVLPLTEAAASQHVSVFTREQIDRERPASVAQFLARRAGIVIDRSPRSGAYASLFLRGADPSHVVVLIDGIRQNDPLSSRGSAVDLNTLTLDDIERIEIVRGNATVVHPEALAGVVQLFTRAPVSAPRASVGLERGGEGLAAERASIALGAWQASISRRKDGERDRTGFGETRAANVSVREQWGATRLQAQLRFSEASHLGFPDDSGGLRHARIRTLEERDADSNQLSFAVDHQLGKASALALQFTRFERDTFQHTPPVLPGVRDPFGLPRIQSAGTYRRNELQASWRWAPAPAWETVIGIGSRDERGSLDSTIFIPVGVPASFDVRRITNSVFGEARRSSGRWSAHAGLRLEHAANDTYSHPALGLQYQATAASPRLGLALSSASKLPSFYALGHPLVGNPQLKRESSRQAEVYIATPERAPWKSRLTLFHARYQDLIDFEPGPPPQLVNRNSVRTTGVEVTARRRWNPAFLTYGSLTWMQLRQPEGSPPLRHRPRRQAALGTELQMGPDWRAHAALAYIGERADSSIPTGDVTLGGYADLSLSLTRLAKKWEAYAAVDNALDKKAEEVVGTPVTERRLRVGVRLLF